MNAPAHNRLNYEIKKQELNVLDACNDLKRCDGIKLLTARRMMIHEDTVGIQSKPDGGCGYHSMRHLQDCPKCKTGTMLSNECIDCGFVIKNRVEWDDVCKPEFKHHA